MEPGRRLLAASLAGLAASLAAAVTGAFVGGSLALRLGHAHGIFALVGFLLPHALFLQAHLLGRVLSRTLPAAAERRTILVGTAGTLIAAAASLWPTPAIQVAGYRIGLLVVTAAGVLHMVAMKRLLPRRSQSVVDVKRDPLTKGDDACFTQLRFAYFLLVLSLAATAAAPWWLAAPVAKATLLAGLHLFLGGFLLLSTYATAHLAVPRLSGVPAIAAGAIKGELHTTLLGLLGLVAGFLVAPWNPGLSRGLTVGLGFFVFVGAFTFMGVLGANIMKNKSRTQRVTREFVYIPWVFAGVFWLLCGILMGMFLKAVPPMLQPQEAALRFMHVHTALFGGFTMLGLGLLSRLLPDARGAPPPTFGAQKLAFYGLNAGLFLLVAGELSSGRSAWTYRTGALLVAFAMAGWFMTLRRHFAPRDADATRP